MSEIARRLGVDEVSLRMSVDELSPYPTVDVLAAVVQAYGVDPGWLLSGKYTSASHRSVADERRELVAQSIRLMIDQRPPQGENPTSPGLAPPRDD